MSPRPNGHYIGRNRPFPTQGVLRMHRVKTLPLVAAVALAAGLGLTRPGAAEPPPGKPADAPALVPGKWVLTEWMAPHFPTRRAVLTVAEKDGKPAITAVEDDDLQWQPKGAVVVAGRRVTFTITRKGPLDDRFDGLFDPAVPTRVLGSLWSGTISFDRAVLELAPPAGAPKPRKPVSPAEWDKYLELAVEYGQADAAADGPTFMAKPAAEQAALRAAAAAAREKYFAEVPRLFRKLVADRPDDPFGYEAALELFRLLDRLKPAPAEIDEWAKVARKFAATHGPQFEAGTLGRITTVLVRHADYAAQARALAAEADKLAEVAGIPARNAAMVAEYDEERAARARQPNPPAAGATWTVTLKGLVTDAQGKPVPDAEVIVNNTQWVKTFTEDGSY